MKTLDNAPNKGCDQKPCDDTQQHVEDDRLLELEEENEEEEGRSGLTDSKKVLNPAATVLSLEQRDGSKLNRSVTQRNVFCTLFNFFSGLQVC